MVCAAPVVFDGHNDVLSKLHRAGGLSQVQSFIDGWDADVDLPKSRAGGFGGGFFAVYVSSPDETREEEMMQPAYDLPLPDPIPCAEALPNPPS